MTSWKIFLESWKKIYRQRWRFLIAVSLLHFFSAVAGTFLLSFLLQTFLAWLGYDNLNKDNFGDILMNPLAIGAALIYALVVAFFLLFEFSFLFQLVLASRRRVNFSLRRVVVGAFTEFRAVLNPQIFLLLIYFVAMIPLSNLGLSSFLLEKLYIPKFITEELLKSSLGATVYFGFLLAIFWVNFRLIFLLPLTIINKNSILRNARWSWRLSRKYFTKLFGVGLFYVLLMVMILTIMAIFASVIFEIINPQISALETMLIFGFINDAVIFVLAIFSKVFFAEILLCFLLDEEKLPVESRLNYPKQTEIVRARWILAASVVILAGALTWNVWTFYSTKINRQVEIIAHRGETSAAVENSLEALENAKKSGADAMETDVILTRDHKFVVIHDFSLNRLASRPERIQDLTLAELKNIEISAGEFKSRLVSFEEFATRARKLNMKLFVELKLHGSEPQNYTDLFLAEWKKANLPSGSRVISLNLPALEKIEHKKPEISTGHIIPFQFGRLNLRTKVDFFVVEDFSFNKNLAKQAHQAGKKIYVWTINEEQIIANYLHSNADGIITDNAQAAIELRTTRK